MTRTAAPESSQFELSLFGPGVGEAIVVHLGHQQWMIVDSCLDASGRPAALTYLEQFNVDISSQVKLIVVTHWHDDHIGGIAQICREAHSANFVCSAALKGEEFLTLVCAASQVKLVSQTSGLSEFAEVLEILRDRGDCPQWAHEGSVVFRRNGPFMVRVHALSPSNHTLTEAHQKLGAMIPEMGSYVRRVPLKSPNDLSLALLIETSIMHCLLGADLETGTPPHSGWHAVLRSRVRPNVRSTSIKVPHHGSEDADLEEVWTELLVDSPYALVAPFGKGAKPLPSREDVDRLKARTTELYCSVWPPNISPPRRHNAVDKTVREITTKRRALRRKPGHIRVRASRGDARANVELFDGAKRLSAI